MGLEPTNLLTASQALYQLSYAPDCESRHYQGPQPTELPLDEKILGATKPG